MTPLEVNAPIDIAQSLIKREEICNSILPTCCCIICSPCILACLWFLGPTGSGGCECPIDPFKTDRRSLEEIKENLQKNRVSKDDFAKMDGEQKSLKVAEQIKIVGEAVNKLRQLENSEIKNCAESISKKITELRLTHSFPMTDQGDHSAYNSLPSDGPEYSFFS